MQNFKALVQLPAQKSTNSWSEESRQVTPLGLWRKDSGYESSTANA